MEEVKKDFNEKIALGCHTLEHGNLDRVTGLFMRGLNAGPDCIEKAFLYADFIVQAIQHYHEAASIFYDLAIEHPENPWPYLYHGLIYLVGNVPGRILGEKAIDVALADFTAAIIADPKNPIVYYARAKARFYVGDVIEALEDAQMACAYSESCKTTIDYGKFLEFIEKEVNKGDFFEYITGGGNHQSLKERYEEQKGARDEGWILINWDHRFKIKPGDLLRQYVSPYRCPDEIFYNEYEVSRGPHSRAAMVYWHKKGLKESIGFTNGEYSQTRSFFENEIWIKRDNLTHWKKRKSWSSMPVFIERMPEEEYRFENNRGLTAGLPIAEQEGK